MARVRHLWIALVVWPGLLFSARRRALFREMRAFIQRLPAVLRDPLPVALQQLTSAGQPVGESEQTIRRLADLTALLDRRSPLGLCLRRSLTRYHFLRRAGVPVVLRFGAKFADGKPDRAVTGHAWLTLGNRPYHELDENWRDFNVMLTFPKDA